MKKVIRYATVLFCLALLSCIFQCNAYSDDVSNKPCGEGIFWSYNSSNKTLTISGNGPMVSWEGIEPPWMECDFQKIVIKEGITHIGACSFEECGDEDKLSVTLPKSLESIDKYAFRATGIKRITLPKNLKSLGRGVFEGSDLKEFKVANGNKYFSTKKGVLFNKKKTVLYHYPANKKGKSYTVPSSVKTIKAYAFAGSEAGIGSSPSIKSITLPAGLKKIEGHAFQWSEIKKFTFRGKPPRLGKDVFYGNESTILYQKKYQSQWNEWKEAIWYNSEAYDEDTSLTFKAY